MKFRLYALLAFLLASTMVQAQETFPAKTVIQGRFVKKTVPLRDFPTTLDAEYKVNEIKIVPNNLRANEKLNANAYPQNGIDPLRQKNVGGVTLMPVEENFDGLTQGEGGGFTPPDPTGAAGPNHYIAGVNVAIKIFDKQGNVLAGPTMLGTFLGNGSNAGDPIFMYDHLADRYFVSQFQFSNNGLVIGVSETSDPTGAYNVYQFPLDAFPDYPHYTVWPDGYYMTANKFVGNTTYVIERQAMIDGEPTANIVGFSLPGVVENSNTVFSPEPANLTGVDFPANVPGYIVYMQDDGWGGGITNDHLKIWEIEVDWNNPASSTISAPVEIPIAPFDSVFAPFGTGDVAQPGTGQKIDMIGGVISYASNYRSFGSHNSWLVTFNVDVDGNDTSGIRWIELRNTGNGAWSLFQEGTYAPADGHSRFMGSAGMDAAGNIGMGFHIASATLPVGIKYTGRFDGDPAGQMTVAEETIIDGIGVQTFSNRFGDYSHLTMDPDNFTFWHTAEYFASNNNWRSRVASFTLSGGFTADVGVNAIIQPENGVLTNAETVEISIRNYGTGTQSNIPVELLVDDVVVATETFNGSIAGGDVANYTFAQTVDLSTVGQTYTIKAATLLAGDEFNPNDDFEKEVTHLYANDVGPLELVAPASGSGLGMQTISVNLKNFGVDTQSNFDVQYTVNGGTPVVETFAGSLDQEEEAVFNFSTQADLTEIGSYTIEITTSLSGDQNTDNDTLTAEVENFMCQPEMDCSFGDGLQLFSIAEINNPSGCEGYADFTDEIAYLEPGMTYDLTMTTGYGDQHVTVWIDFNDDYDFTNDEKVVVDYVIAPGQGSGTYTETTDLTVPAGVPPGDHLMRAKTNWQAPVPDDACEETQYGETEDYTANTGILSISDQNFANSELVVLTLPNNQFDITLTTNYDKGVYAALYNVLGQQLKFKTLTKSSENSYQIKLDMSQMASGVYLIKLSGADLKTYKTARIIVK